MENHFSKYKYNSKKNIKEYQTWKNMISRCYDEDNDHYKYYGKVGVRVCDRWIESFDNFMEDMGKRPDGMSIDRIDLRGDYCPENCRWANSITQANNKSNNRYFNYKGESLTIPELARKYGIKEGTIRSRVYTRKMTIEEAIEMPIQERRNFECR